MNANINITSGGVHIGEVEEADIKVTSGTIKVEKANRITAKATSGSIGVTEINGFCDLYCNSGTIKVEKCKLNENSSMRTTSGGVIVKETNAIFIDAHATSGGVKVNGSDRKSEIELKINTTSGGIKVNQ